ncbi:hypothetical protein JCM8097_000004 [Rhodosporidiobolus ruineniae]
MVTTRVFFLGATGYVGSPIASRLVERGFQLTAPVRKDESRAAALRQRGVHTVVGTLDSVELIKEQAESSDAVFTAAANSHMGSPCLPSRTYLHRLSAPQRLDRLEHSKNPFHHLPLDARDPPPPLPQRSYAAAAARPPSHTPPPPRASTRSLSAAPPRPQTTQEVVLLRSSSLPPTHPLLLVPNERLTGCVKRWVRDTGLLPADYVAAAGRMERGNIRIVLSSPHAAALFRRTLPHLLPTAELMQAPEKMGIVVHFVPIELDKARMREAVERWSEEEGVEEVKWAVKRVWATGGKEGALFRSCGAEFWNCETVTSLVSTRLRTVGNSAAVEVEQAWPRRERGKGREEEENARVKELSGVLPSPAELAAALADAPQSTPAAPLAPSRSPPRTPSPKPTPTAYPPVAGPSLDNSPPRALPPAHRPEPRPRRLCLLRAQALHSADHDADHFSLPVPTRLLPAWRTYDSEEMSRLAKEGHKSVDAWIEEEEAKKR